VITAIFSDVHGNLPFLEKFVEITRDRADAYLCLGDVVNYGPWSDECVELTLSLPNITLLEGNHERLFLGEEHIEQEPPLVRAFYDATHSDFTRFDSIRGLPRDAILEPFVCTHTVGDTRIYADTQIDIDRSYIIGHSHHQFRIERSGYTLINCGSLGQNRKSLELACYALYDDESRAVTLCEVEVSADRIIQEMNRRNFPDACIAYYRSKLTASR
jgi:predicted phosphodiesterase